MHLLKRIWMRNKGRKDRTTFFWCNLNGRIPRKFLARLIPLHSNEATCFKYVLTVQGRRIKLINALTHIANLTGCHKDRRISTLGILVNIVGTIVEDYVEDTEDPRMTAYPAATWTRSDTQKMRRAPLLHRSACWALESSFQKVVPKMVQSKMLFLSPISLRTKRGISYGYIQFSRKCESI